MPVVVKLVTPPLARALLDGRSETVWNCVQLLYTQKATRQQGNLSVR